MSYRYVEVKRFKRGATWPDGQPRICTRCRVEDRARCKRATVTALLQYVGSKYKVPVAYCPEHVPTALAK